MTPLEMIAEWRKGCSCGGPVFDQILGNPEGTTSPAECIECTEGLIDALEKVLPGYVLASSDQGQAEVTAIAGNEQSLLGFTGISIDGDSLLG